MDQQTKAKGYAQAMYEKNGKVDIVKLANSLGITVYSDNDTDINGKISFNEKKGFEITFNMNHPMTRIRFSIAHEIAHFLLHQQKIKAKGCLYRDGATDQEKEADVLAAELLMPKEGVKEVMDKFNQNNIGEEVVQQVATKFAVSMVVAAIRLRSLKFKVPYISCSHV